MTLLDGAGASQFSFVLFTASGCQYDPSLGVQGFSRVKQLVITLGPQDFLEAGAVFVSFDIPGQSRQADKKNKSV